MLKIRIVTTYLSISIIFSIVFVQSAPRVEAWWTASPNFAPDMNTTMNQAAQTPLQGSISGTSAAGAASEGKKVAMTLSEKLSNAATVWSLTALKMAALVLVQKITQEIIGKGDGGVVSDWNKYLYISPHQKAMDEMNSFFNTVSRGRLSSLNYEGVGPNYDAYLVSQARQSISGQSFSTNIQSYASDPTRMFDGGNMKGIMSYIQCANNVACYTLTAQDQYEKELAKAKEIALREQKDGFTPVKKNGKIIQPAAILASALTQIDQLGTTVIMNAEAKTKGEFSGAAFQVGQGAAMNIVSRSFNYMTSDKEARDAIQNKNNAAPFSIGYNAALGFGLNVGGVNFSLGAGAIASQLMIGNTCATAVGTIDGGGATVTIEGRKYDCKTKTLITGTGPTVQLTLPSINCLSDNACNNACDLLPGCVGPLRCLPVPDKPTQKKCFK